MRSRSGRRGAGALVAALLMLAETAGAAPAANPAPPGRAGEAEAAMRHERRRLIERLGRRAGFDPLPQGLPSYQVFANLERKGDLTRSTRPVDPPDAHGVIRRLAELPCSARDGEAEAAWLLRAAWGVDAAPVWSVGLAALEAGTLYGRPLRELTQALRSADLLPSLDELMEADPAVAQYPTLFAPAAGALVSWVLEEHGTAGLRRAVLATVKPRGRSEVLARSLGMADRLLGEAYARALGPAAGRPPRHTSKRAAAVPPGMQRGVCYAHTVSLERGYASRQSERNLDTLAAIGINWISVTPFGYLELHSPEIAASSAFGPDAETDESLAAVLQQASARGLRVLVKPHLWSTDFVGRIRMRSDQDWRRFFLAYSRYIAHHAVLAEACGASALCVGNELIEATRGRDPQWRTLIAAARALFSGPLTYGAHWDEEVERIGFWDALDWVGVSLYAPLATDTRAGPAEWRAAAHRQSERLVAIARRAGKPLVLVEAGFPSHPRAPLAPWEVPQDGPADSAVQAQAFLALLEAFGSRPEVKGIYWWKWFTDEPPPPGDRTHRFAGKPAEQILRRFYPGR